MTERAASEPTPDLLPRTGRLAAIDYGSVRIGVAITDPDQRFASPLENYTRRSAEKDATWLKQWIGAERVVGLVVGLPLHTTGNESQKSAEVRKFVAWLQTLIPIPLVFFDERFTTSQANELLAEAGFSAKQRKERRDKLAAQILLVSYLESSRTAETLASLDDR